MSDNTHKYEEQPTMSMEPRVHTSSVDDESAMLENSKTKLPTFADIKTKLTTKHGWFGDYSYGFLCMPTLPYSRFGTSNKATPFYGLDESMPIILAAVCGFQHALAMLAGVITPPIVISSSLSLPVETQVYLVSASLISSGILSMFQMMRFKIPFINVWFGTGLITVVGTSFASLSTAASIFTTLYRNGTCPSTMTNGVMTRLPCPEAYGYLIGTAALVSLLEMGMAFIPIRILRKMFPPIVTGVVIMLIGASLIGKSGFLNWAGGSNACRSRPTTGLFRLCPNINAPRPLPWGSAEFLGLGFLTFITIVIVEIFGSPFMRSASIIMGLIVGMIVAGATGYVDGASIRRAPGITFLWVETFPLKVYGPAILPLMAVYITLAMEAIGDITASSEASRQPVDGPLYDSRIQGGVLADGFNGMLSCLFTNTPVSIFAQNNGVISLTRVANRGAGVWCASFLILFGILAKISGVFLAIPNSVLGGVTTFLFASVVASGIRVISYCKFTRRERFILAASFSLGVGSLLVSDWANYLFTYSGSNNALRGFLDSIVIVLSTPFLICAVVGIILNGILPADPPSELALVSSPTGGVTAAPGTTGGTAATGKGAASASKEGSEYEDTKKERELTA